MGRKLPFVVVTKPTEAACNLDCSNLFLSLQRAALSRIKTTDGGDRLEQYVRTFLAEQPDGPVTFVWQGGEPTLMGLEFFRRAVALAESHRRPAQEVSHSFQTNGVVIDDQWAEFFAKNNLLVALSIDGPKDVHDLFRVNKAGRGTFDQVVRGWRCLQRHGVKTNILCTVHTANEHRALDVYRFFRDELGAEFVQFIPIVERVARQQWSAVEHARQSGTDRTDQVYLKDGEAVTSRSVKPVEYGTFLSAIFDEWVRVDVGKVFVQIFEVVLSAMFGQCLVCVHAPECGNALVLMHNGDEYSCDHYVEPENLLGNVNQGSF